MSETSDASEVATAGSDGARPSHIAQTGPVRPRGEAVKRKADTPLTELKPKHRLLITYMVNGCPHDWITQYTRPCPTEDEPDAVRVLNPNEPLRLEEAAKALRFKLRDARSLFTKKLFQRELAKELEALRDGAKARALHRVIALVDEEGEGKAADRKVQLQAAQALLGDSVGAPAKAPPVNVNVGVNLQPGIVIRLPASLPATPLERQTIDATPLPPQDDKDD